MVFRFTRRGDDSQYLPFTPCRPTIAQVLHCIPLLKLPLLAIAWDHADISFMELRTIALFILACQGAERPEQGLLVHTSIGRTPVFIEVKVKSVSARESLNTAGVICFLSGITTMMPLG